LLENKPEMLGVRRVPNARLCADDAIDPEDVWSLSETLPYEVDVRWSDEGAGEYFDIVFHPLMTQITQIDLKNQRNPWIRQYANNPLRGGLDRNLVSRLRGRLEEKLPDYMIPSGFVILDQIPLTVSGKVDRQALPDVDHEHSDLATNYVGPRSETENVITQIWQQVLDVKKLGIHDNFFDLGGHSLLMVQVYNKLREAFHKDVPMVELFRNPTIATLSRYFSGDAAPILSLKKTQERASRRVAASSRSNN